MLTLTDIARELYNLLYTKSFDSNRLRAALSSGRYSQEDVDLAAFFYVDDCLEDMEGCDEASRHMGEIKPGYESSHMVEAIGILLEYGLDPNKKFIVSETDNYKEESNIMSELRYVENGYVAADTLAMLLEHGGDPCMLINGNSLVRDINFDVLFDLNELPNRCRYDALVHYWMVLVGYGARLENGEPTVDLYKNFDVSKLRDHRNYYYGAIQADQYENHVNLIIFDRRTNWEVVRL